MDLEEEYRNNFFISNERKKLWNLQLYLLKEFDRVCKKYDLKYFADGGTLLGTVREKGFIAWDDDIDLIMLREDYDKLVSLGNKVFKDECFLQNFYTDNLFRVHSQLRLKNTTMLLKSDFGTKYNKGIFIDIFVLDKVPVDQSARENFYLEIRKNAKLINVPHRYICNSRFKQFVSDFIKLPIKFVLYYLRKLFYGGLKKQSLAFEKLLKKYEKLNEFYLSNVGFEVVNQLPNKLRNPVDYLSSVSFIFEDTIIPIPIGYDGVLKLLYGDYLIPSKVPTIHGTVFVDFDNSYTMYENFSKHNFLRLFDEFNL